MSSHNSFEDGNDHEVFIYVKEEMNSHPGDIVDADMLLNRESSDPLNEDYSRPFKGKEVLTLPNFNSSVQMLWQSQPPSTSEVNLYPLHAEHSVPFKMFSQDYPHEVQYQEFQYFVVIDFEATCDKENNLQPQEIIEFPSVLVNAASGQLEAFFQTYVRPTHHQLLTDFCKELTGIEQIQVDKGISLSEALLMHDRWLEDKGVKQKNFAVVTWSNWDCRVMLESECRFRRIRKPPYFNRWINLKIPFQEVYGDVQCKLKEAVQLAGLVWEGRAHCGLDDARNTARLLTVIMNHGFRFFITNWLTVESQDYQLEHEAHKQRHTIEPGLQFDPVTDKETGIYCFCGVMSSKCVVRKPGPTQGRWFYGCGNWSSARRALCHFFMWASP